MEKTETKSVKDLDQKAGVPKTNDSDVKNTIEAIEQDQI